MRGEATGGSAGARGAVTGLGIVAGWVAHDLGVLAAGEEPWLARELVAGWLACGAVGLGLGFLLGAVRRLWPVVLALAAVGAVLPRFWEPPLNPVTFIVPKALWVVFGAVGVLWFMEQRGWKGRFLPAMGAGTLVAVTVFVYRLTGWETEQRGTFLAVEATIAVAGLALVAVTRVTADRVRRALVAGVLVVALIAGLGAARRAYRVPPPSPGPDRASAPAGARNLLVVVLDTVGAHHLDLYGYERETMPRLTAFAAGAQTGRQCRSTSSWTVPSHGSLFTGLVPSLHGATHPRNLPADHPLADASALPLRRDVPTLAGRLTQAGWQTGGVIGNSPYISRRFGFDRGFEFFDDRNSLQTLPRFALPQMFGAAPRVGFLPYRSAERITDESIDWLERRDGRPFFLFVNYMDAHFPYLPARGYRDLFEDWRPRDPLYWDVEDYPLRYDRELRYLDDQLGRLLDWVRDQGLLDDTVVVITSDHGETFGEHGFWFHNVQVYDGAIRVPLVMHFPGGARGTVDDHPLNSADLYRLALRSVGLDASEPNDILPLAAEWYQREKHALKHPTDPDLLRRDLLTWLDGSQKWIVGSRGEVELYDVFLDPEELNDLSDAVPPERVEAALELAREWWRTHPPLIPDAGGEMDPDTLDRLRSLGYVD